LSDEGFGTEFCSSGDLEMEVPTKVQAKNLGRNLWKSPGDDGLLEIIVEIIQQ